jgi:hypothetical protein
MDATILRMRASRQSWEAIESALGLSHWTIAERGRSIGAALPAPDPDEPDPIDLTRDPLPPGHPESWGAITAGTCLAGAAYR